MRQSSFWMELTPEKAALIRGSLRERAQNLQRDYGIGCEKERPPVYSRFRMLCEEKAAEAKRAEALAEEIMEAEHRGFLRRLNARPPGRLSPLVKIAAFAVALAGGIIEIMFWMWLKM